MTFSKLAKFYNQVNELESYDTWLDFTLDQVTGPPKAALDLACGTGYFTCMWAPFCQNLIGLDLDSTMIEVAKADGKDYANVSFQVGDMRNLSFEEASFDCITCYLDSLCFLPSLEDLQDCFREVYRVLQEGGHFFFDVWTPNFLLEFFDDFINVESFEDGHLIWQSQVSPKNLSVHHQLLAYELMDKHGSEAVFRQTRTNLYEKTYPLADYFAALEGAGFDRRFIILFPDFNSAKDDNQAARWVFKITK